MIQAIKGLGKINEDGEWKFTLIHCRTNVTANKPSFKAVSEVLAKNVNGNIATERAALVYASEKKKTCLVIRDFFCENARREARYKRR